MNLEAAGLPTVLVATGELRPLADRTAADLGLPDLRVVSIQHPIGGVDQTTCLLYTSPSPRDATLSRMPSSA